MIEIILLILLIAIVIFITSIMGLGVYVAYKTVKDLFREE